MFVNEVPGKLYSIELNEVNWIQKRKSLKYLINQLLGERERKKKNMHETTNRHIIQYVQNSIFKCRSSEQIN